MNCPRTSFATRCRKCGSVKPADDHSLPRLQFAQTLLKLREHVYPRIQCVLVLCEESAEPEVADTGINREAISPNCSALYQSSGSSP